MKPGKILITGASGFIGSNLWRYFVNNGYDVVACVRKMPVAHILPNSKIHVTPTLDTEISAILQTEQPRYLIHCAGTASVMQSYNDPKADFVANVVLTEKILEALAQHSPQTKFIFLSSGAVYGNPAQLPITEDTAANPISPYGFHKLLCEHIVKKYHILYKIPAIILRIFSVYGRGLKKQLLWDIYQKAEHDNIIKLYGSGQETRDFIYIDDVARVIHHTLTQTDYAAKIFNIATGQAVTIRAIAEIMVEKLNINKTIQFGGEKKLGDPLYWSVSSQQMQTLGISDWVPVETGIQHYINWLQTEECAK